MTSRKLFRKIIPVVLAGAAAIVMAVPMTAMAGDWNRHDNVRHENLVRHDSFVRHENLVNREQNQYRLAQRAYVPNYYGYAPQGAEPMYGAGVPAYAAPYAGGAYGAGAYGAGPCGNVSRLENVYRHDRNTGHPAAANDVLHQMQTAEGRCGGVSSVAPLAGNANRYAYGQNGSAFSPLLGNFLGIR
ncbi:MAG TPA: hypothetical protein VJX23_05635 [Candidatus Binataceae bacterium]|nr:hypothetical protein [Candidatus Binataceae bacterium]